MDVWRFQRLPSRLVRRWVPGVALLAALALPGPARADAAVEVIWTDTTNAGATAQRGVGTRAIYAQPGDQLEAKVYLTAGTEGISAYSISLVFDPDLMDELDLVNVTTTPPPPLTEFGPPITNESSSAEIGFVYSINAGTFGIGIFDVTVPIATLTFQVTANVASDGDDLFSGLFNTGTDGIFDAMSLPVTVTFANARVDEPPAIGWRFDVVARSGTPVPGGSGTFTDFERFPGFRRQLTRFSGSGSVGERGIYGFSAASGLQRFVDHQTPVPGGGGATFDAFGDADYDENLAFVGFDPGGIAGIYEAKLGQGQAFPLAVQGVTALPGSVELFASFGGVARAGADTAFGGVGDAGTVGIYALRNGGLETVADTATPVPGLGTPFIDLETSPCFHPGEVVFQGQHAAGAGIYREAGGSLSTVVDTSTLVPHAGARTFAQFLAASAHAGRVAFDATHSGAGGQGIYLSDPLVRIADHKTPVPEGSGDFIGFASVALHGGHVAFLGEEPIGIYTTLAGGLSKVIAVGEPLDGGIVADLDLGEGALDGRKLTFWASFEDGSQGIFLATLPGIVPALGPLGLALLAATLLGAGVGLRARRRGARPGTGRG